MKSNLCNLLIHSTKQCHYDEFNVAYASARKMKQDRAVIQQRKCTYGRQRPSKSHKDLPIHRSGQTIYTRPQQHYNTSDQVMLTSSNHCDDRLFYILMLCAPEACPWQTEWTEQQWQEHQEHSSRSLCGCLAPGLPSWSEHVHQDCKATRTRFQDERSDHDANSDTQEAQSMHTASRTSQHASESRLDC